MVPLMGLVRVDSAKACSATVRFACAVSMAAWSAAICCGVFVDAEEAPPALPPVLPPAPAPVPLPELPVEPLGVVESAFGVAVGEPDVPADPWLRACDRAASSLATATWSPDTFCWSVET